MNVDVGANYMHKCYAGDDQPVFKLAKEKKTKVTLSCANMHFFLTAGGTRVPLAGGSLHRIPPYRAF